MTQILLPLISIFLHCYSAHAETTMSMPLSWQEPKEPQFLIDARNRFKKEACGKIDLLLVSRMQWNRHPAELPKAFEDLFQQIERDKPSRDRLLALEASESSLSPEQKMQLVDMRKTGRLNALLLGQKVGGLQSEVRKINSTYWQLYESNSKHPALSNLGACWEFLDEQSRKMQNLLYPNQDKTPDEKKQPAQSRKKNAG